MFITIELQTNTDGTVGTLVTTHNTLAEAQNKFYTICAFAVLSKLPIHSAVILDPGGVLIASESFQHEPEPEPTPDPEPEESEGE